MGKAKKTRHGYLAGGLSGLRYWREQPEGPIEPLQTNWTVSAANDNTEPEEIVDYGFERHLRITPSVEEIMRHVDTGATVKNDDGQIVRIGGLRFSDGTQTERGWTDGPNGDVISVEFPMPVGSMLGCREKAEGQAGGRGYTDGELEQSNLYFARMLGTIEPRYVKRTARRNGKSYTADESRAMLAEAIANTPHMPRVTYLKPGLPCGGRRVAESFVGMQKGRKGESGSIMWQDLSSSMAQREIWEATLAEMRDADKRTLDTVSTAKTMKEIGEAHGFAGKRAERMGKAILVAANDNFEAAFKKNSA